VERVTVPVKPPGVPGRTLEGAGVTERKTRVGSMASHRQAGGQEFSLIFVFTSGAIVLYGRCAYAKA